MCSGCSPCYDIHFAILHIAIVSHVGVRRGELANRILTVGDPARAIVLSLFLDGVDRENTPPKTVPANLFSFASHRGFLTITGRYKGVPVSIVAIGKRTSIKIEAFFFCLSWFFAQHWYFVFPCLPLFNHGFPNTPVVV